MVTAKLSGREGTRRPPSWRTFGLSSVDVGTMAWQQGRQCWDKARARRVRALDSDLPGTLGGLRA